MSKGLTQRQWLNMVIIIISALILAFMLIGQVMNKSVDKVAGNVEQTPFRQIMSLREIDFGSQKLVLQTKSATSWTVIPNNSLTSEEIFKLVKNWQNVLVEPITPSLKNIKNIASPVTTVLLFFSESTQPLIVKIGGINRPEGQKLVSLLFIGSEQQEIIKPLSLEQFLPKNFILDKKL